MRISRLNLVLAAYGAVFGMIFFAPLAYAESLKSISNKITKLERKVSTLEVTLASALSRKTAKKKRSLSPAADSPGTSWSGTIYSPSATGVNEKTIAVTFTATSETRGTWTSSPYNLVTPAYAFFPETEQDTFSGEYRIIQNSMFFFNAADSQNVATGTGGSVVVDVKDDGLLFSSFSTSLPSPLVKLSPQ